MKVIKLHHRQWDWDGFSVHSVWYFLCRSLICHFLSDRCAALPQCRCRFLTVTARLKSDRLCNLWSRLAFSPLPSTSPSVAGRRRRRQRSAAPLRQSSRNSFLREIMRELIFFFKDQIFFPLYLQISLLSNSYKNIDFDLLAHASSGYRSRSMACRLRDQSNYFNSHSVSRRLHIRILAAGSPLGTSWLDSHEFPRSTPQPDLPAQAPNTTASAQIAPPLCMGCKRSEYGIK